MNRTRRRAYTLLEIVLVVAILVMVMSVLYPIAAGWFSHQKTISAADHIRAKLTDTRTLAQKEGKAYKFVFKENTPYYRYAPEGDELWENDEGWIDLNKDQGTDFLFSVLAAELAGDPQATDGTRSITFLPDGTARSNTRVGVSNSQGQSSVVLQVRSATGAVTEEVEGPPQ